MREADVERLLRAHYADDRDDEPPMPALEVVITDGRRLSRQRRRVRGFAGAIAVASTVAAIAVAVTALTDSTSRTRDGAPAAPTSDDAVSTDLMSWAGSLDPVAAPDDVAILAGRSLMIGSRAVAVRQGTDLGLEAMTDAGAVVLIERDRTGSGGQFTSESVIVGPDRRMRRLPSGSGTTIEVVRSPDGSLLAHDGQVLDVRTLEVVATLPPEAVTLEAWTTAGIVIRDRGSRQFLFDPETGVTAVIVGDPGIISDGASAGIASAGGCPVVTTLDSGGVVRQGDSLCAVLDRRTAVAVSPEGTSVVTDELEVVDVASGSVRRLGPPALADPLALVGEGEFVWSSDHQFYFVVRGAASAVVVGCDLKVDDCSRVGEEISIDRTNRIRLAAGAE